MDRSYISKPSTGAVKSVNVSFCEDISAAGIPKKFAFPASDIAKEMRETLNKLEKNEANLSKEIYTKKIKEALKGFFNDIIKLEPEFAYILQRIKYMYENSDIELLEKLAKEAKDTKAKNEELERSLAEVNKKTAALESANLAAKKANEKIEKEANEVRLKLFDARNKLAETLESGMAVKIAEEMEELQKENRRLVKLINALESDLRKAKSRENTLIALMQGKEESLQNNDYDKEEDDIRPLMERKANATIEVGKNKVKIPILDFTMIQPSISNDCEEGPEAVDGEVRLSGTVQPNKYGRFCYNSQ